jgi:hypothetical protein
MKINNNFINKFRIGIINDDIDNIQDYIFEIKNIKLLDINNKSDPNELILNIYLYNYHYKNICTNIKKYFKQISNNIPCKISLFEKIPNNKIFGYNDILWVMDIRITDIGYNNYKDIFKKFKKENIIWYNYESPYHNKHSWWLNPSFLNNFGMICSTFLNKGKKIKNSIWFLQRSATISEYSYKNHIINNLNYDKFITVNPFTHKGNCNEYTFNKFGNRGDIIKTLLDNNLNIDIYGVEMIPELKEYAIHFKGNIGDRYTCDFGLSKINKLSEYKFIIICENLFIDGYITEKLSDVLLCNRVPIYFGGPNIHKILPKLFNQGVINGFEFDTLDDLINCINNMSDEEYLKRINTIKHERNNLFELFNIQTHISYIFTKLLKNKGIDIYYDETVMKLHKLNLKIRNNLV